MITIWLTWTWTRRVAGTRAAAFTVALLSTDAIFIVTNTFDWGPVAFQHVFLMGGLVAIHIWLQRAGHEYRFGTETLRSGSRSDSSCGAWACGTRHR